MKSRRSRVLELPLIAVAALLFLFEDFLWAWLEAFLERLARLPGVAWLEARIERLPPYPAMAVFLMPVAILFPAHLLAVYFAAIGRVELALLVYVVVKLVGTAVLARIYVLCQPALLSLAWFARLREWVLRTKAWLYARLEAMPPWQAARRAVRRMRALLGTGSLRARAEAIRRRWRRA